MYVEEGMNGEEGEEEEEEQGVYDPLLDRGSVLNLVDDLLEKYSLGKKIKLREHQFPI